jgi:hypothetical protein
MEYLIKDRITAENIKIGNIVVYKSRPCKVTQITNYIPSNLNKKFKILFEFDYNILYIINSNDKISLIK